MVVCFVPLSIMLSQGTVTIRHHLIRQKRQTYRRLSVEAYQGREKEEEEEEEEEGERVRSSKFLATWTPLTQMCSWLWRGAYSILKEVPLPTLSLHLTTPTSLHMVEHPKNSPHPGPWDGTKTY